MLWRTRMQQNNDHASGVLMDGGEQLHCQRGRVQPGYRVKRWPVWNLARREFQPGSVTGTKTFFGLLRLLHFQLLISKIFPWCKMQVLRIDPLLAITFQRANPQFP